MRTRLLRISILCMAALLVFGVSVRPASGSAGTTWALPIEMELDEPSLWLRDCSLLSRIDGLEPVLALYDTNSPPDPEVLPEPIPEPLTLGLLSVGGLIILRRRR
jgi:hypothetical protein